MLADIKFECTECGQPIAVDSTAAGRSASCPSCLNQFVVPTVGGLNDRNYGAAPRGARLGGLGAGPGFWQETAIDDGDPTQNGGTDRDSLASPRQCVVNPGAQEIELLREQLESGRDECERLHAAATHLQAELKSFHAERLTLKNELAQLRHRLAATDSEIASRDEALAAAEQIAAEARCECANLQNDLLISKQRLTATQTQLEARERQAVHLQEQLATSRQSEHAALHEVESLHAESALLRAALDSARAELATAAEQQARTHELETTLHEREQKLVVSEGEVRKLKATCDKLRADASSLHRDLKETKSGRSLIDLRSQLATAEEQRRQLTVELRQVAEESARRERSHSELESLLRATRRQLEQAFQAAEASSDSRMRHDNEILRGIISRQNAELESRNVQIIRFKRARFGLRVLYTVFAIVMAAVVAAILYSLPLLAV